MVKNTKMLVSLFLKPPFWNLKAVHDNAYF